MCSELDLVEFSVGGLTGKRRVLPNIVPRVKNPGAIYELRG
jgi:hypothetical protein